MTSDRVRVECEARCDHCRARGHSIAACPRLASILPVNTKQSANLIPISESSNLSRRPPPIEIHRPWSSNPAYPSTTTNVPAHTPEYTPSWYAYASANDYNNQQPPQGHRSNAFPSHAQAFVSQPQAFTSQYQSSINHPPPLPGVDSWNSTPKAPPFGLQYPSSTHQYQAPANSAQFLAFDQPSTEVNTQPSPISDQYKLLASPLTRNGLDPWTPTKSIPGSSSQSPPPSPHGSVFNDQPTRTDSERSASTSPTPPSGSQRSNLAPTTGILGANTGSKEGAQKWKPYVSKIPRSHVYFVDDEI